MIDFGMLKTDYNPMQDIVQGSQMATQLKQSQNQYNMQNALLALSENQNPQYEDYANIMKSYPQLAEVVQAPMQQMGEQRSKQAAQRLAPIIAAMNKKRYDVAGNLLDEQATAYGNSGDEQNAQGFRMMRKMLDIDPELGRTTLNLMGYGLAPQLHKSIMGEQVSQSTIDLNTAKANKEYVDAENIRLTAPAQADKARAEADKTRAETGYMGITTQADINSKLANTDKARAEAAKINDETAAAPALRELTAREKEAQILLNKANIDKAQNPQLSDQATTQINAWTKGAADAERTASNSQILLDGLAPYENENDANFVFQNLFSRAGDGLGFQTAYQTLRTDAERIKNSEAIKSLPPGSASDADIALAMKGVPTRGDTPRIWIRYIRGVNKAANFEKVYNDAASQWASKNNGLLGIARNNMVVDGEPVSAGQTFNNFAKSMAERHFKSIEMQKKEAAKSNRPKGE